MTFAIKLPPPLNGKSHEKWPLFWIPSLSESVSPWDKDIESDLVTETKSGSTEPGKWSRSRRWFCEAICSAATSCSIQSLCQCPCQIVIIDHFLLDEYYLKSVTDRIKIVVSLPTNQTITNNQSTTRDQPASITLKLFSPHGGNEKGRRRGHNSLTPDTTSQLSCYE